MAKMNALQRIFSRSKSKDKERDAPVGGEDGQQRSHPTLQDTQTSGAQKAASHHRWDYSDCVYELDRHPLCRNMSRKLSDLQPLSGSAAVVAAVQPATCKHHVALSGEVTPDTTAVPL